MGEEYQKTLHIEIIREVSNDIRIELKHRIKKSNFKENDIIYKIKNRVDYIFDNIYSKKIGGNLDLMKEIFVELKFINSLLKSDKNEL